MTTINIGTGNTSVTISDHDLTVSIQEVVLSNGQAKLGLPTSGSWTDGYATLAASDLLVDSIDLLNRGLLVVSQASLGPTGPVGPPTIGDWSSGYFAMTNSTKIVDALQGINSGLETVSGIATTPGQQKAGAPPGGWSSGYASFTNNTLIADALNTLNIDLESVSLVANGASSNANTALADIANILNGTSSFTGTVTGTSLILSGTLNVTGTSTLGVANTAALSATTGSFSSTLNVTGLSTLAALNATNGSLSGTLGVTGATTLSSLSATTGAFSSTLSVTGASTLGAVSATTGTFSGTLGVTGISTLGQVNAAAVAGTTGTFTGNVSAAGLRTTTQGGEIQFLGNTVFECDGASVYLSPVDDVNGAFYIYTGGAPRLAINKLGTITIGGAVSTGALTSTTGSFSSTLSVTGTSTLGATNTGALAATTGSFSSTLNVTGSTTIADLTATTGTFNGAVSATAGTFSGNVIVQGSQGVYLKGLSGKSGITDANVPLQLSTGGTGTEAYVGINKNGAYGFLLGFSNSTAGSWPLGGLFRMVTTDPFTFVMGNGNNSQGFSSEGFTHYYGGNANLSTLDLKQVSQLTTLTGASATVATIPAGSLVLMVTARVTTAITSGAGTSWSLGTAAASGNWGSGLGFAAATTITGTSYGASFTGPQMYAASTPVVAAANTGTFSGGAVRVTVYYYSVTAPTN